MKCVVQDASPNTPGVLVNNKGYEGSKRKARQERPEVYTTPPSFSRRSQPRPWAPHLQNEARHRPRPCSIPKSLQLRRSKGFGQLAELDAIHVGRVWARHTGLAPLHTRQDARKENVPWRHHQTLPDLSQTKHASSNFSLLSQLDHLDIAVVAMSIRREPRLPIRAGSPQMAPFEISPLHIVEVCCSSAESKQPGCLYGWLGVAHVAVAHSPRPLWL